MQQEISSAPNKISSRYALARICFSSALAIALYILLFTTESFSSDFFSSRIFFLLVSLLVLGGITGGRRIHPILPVVFFITLTAWFILNAGISPFSWFTGDARRGEILLGGVIAVFFIFKSTQPVSRAAVLALFGCAIMIPVFSFFNFIDGKLLISDDHASFFYRLLLLREQLPAIPFYNTDWNAGSDARDFFATGALNVYPLFSVLSRVTTLIQSYNLTASWIAFLLVPLTTFWASKIFTKCTNISVIAAVISAGSGLIWYRWSLVYGTLGFCTSAALFSLVIALTWRALNEPSALHSGKALLIFIAIWTLFLLWPGSMFMVAPVVCYAALHFTRNLLAVHWRATFNNQRRLLLASAVILCINLPWMLLFAKVSKVASFVAVTKVTQQSQAVLNQEVLKQDAQNQDKKFLLGARGVAGEMSFKSAAKKLREQVGSTNPLIPILLIPGLLLALPSARRLLSGSIAYCVIVGTVIAPLKPHLELERLVLCGVLLAAIPTAVAMAHLFSRLRAAKALHFFHPRRVALTALSIVPLGMLVISPFVAASVASNRSILKFFVAEQIWDGVLGAFRSFGNDNGRILFSGFLLHELDGGHAAPIPALTGVSSVASSQFHNMWSYRQVFPKSYLARGDAGINDYLDTLNIGAVFAHEKQWRDYFANKPDTFELVRNIGRFAFYKRRNFTSNYVLSGSASAVSIKRNQIILTPQTSELVLKFNYLPFLDASGCAIKGIEVAPEITLIKLFECTPGQTVTIKSVSSLKRLIS